MPEIKFSELSGFFDKQIQASRTSEQHQYTLYGGSRGPGKSYWLRWDNLLGNLKLAAQGIKKPMTALFCENYTELRDRQITKIAVEFPDWLGELRDSKQHGLGFHIGEKFGSGVMLLRNLDDPKKYRSSEFAKIAVDELTLTELSTFNILRGSLRWPGVPKPRFTAATNPGGPGHLWVRAFWLDQQFPAEMESIKDEFAFVPALPDDNPHLDAAYWTMLETLPPDLARAWRWGDWDVFEGQFFGELRKGIHGFHGDPPPGWTFRALDYGESTPSSVGWYRVDADGELWRYRELYGPGMLYDQLAEQIKALSVDGQGKPEQVRYTVASPDIFNKRQGTGVVGAETLTLAHVVVIRADDNRIEGWRHTKKFIHARSLHVSLDVCPNWWRTVPAMIYDTLHPEDMDGKGEDHAAEETRYALMSRPQPPIKVVKDEYDPTARLIEGEKEEDEDSASKFEPLVIG